jgi:hypothetical protein
MYCNISARGGVSGWKFWWVPSPRIRTRVWRLRYGEGPQQQITGGFVMTFGKPFSGYTVSATALCTTFQNIPCAIFCRNNHLQLVLCWTRVWKLYLLYYLKEWGYIYLSLSLNTFNPSLI